MKILNTQQIREADQYTIKNEPITSLNLMERAARRCFNFIDHDFHYHRFAIFCGVGNNGGDGLVIARLLAQRGKFTEVFVVRFTENESEDFKANYQRLRACDNVKIVELTEARNSFQLHPTRVIVDAIFGSGLTRPITGFVAGIIRKINDLPNDVISIDSPSGLYNDQPVSDEDVVVRSIKTYTFQLPKLSHFFPENYQYVGDWNLVEIGLSPDFIENAETPYHYLSIEMASKILKKRGDFDHKGTFGHALLIAGKAGSMGAAVLAGKACMRAGAGLTTMHVPKDSLEIVQISIPEVMCITDESEKHFARLFQKADMEHFSSIGIGPGIGTHASTAMALHNALKNFPKPVVLDADAVNILSENQDWIKDVPNDSILTPHLKEFERLVGKCANHFERLDKLRAFCQSNGLYMVLKGRFSMVGCPDGAVYFNSTGNSGMATAGSGDVLAGILTGLLAQGYDSKGAATLGVFLHGLAGDLALKTQSKESLIASDIIDYLGKSYARITV